MADDDQGIEAAIQVIRRVMIEEMEDQRKRLQKSTTTVPFVELQRLKGDLEITAKNEIENDEIKKLKQTGTVQEYITEFENSIDPTLPKSQQISSFLSGLKHEIRHSIRMFKPLTLYQAYTLVKLQEPSNESITQLYSNPSPICINDPPQDTASKNTLTPSRNDLYQPFTISDQKPKKINPSNNELLKPSKNSNKTTPLIFIKDPFPDINNHRIIPSPNNQHSMNLTLNPILSIPSTDIKPNISSFQIHRSNSIPPRSCRRQLQPEQWQNHSKAKQIHIQTNSKLCHVKNKKDIVNGFRENRFILFREVRKNGVESDPLSCAFVIKGYVKMKNFNGITQIHGSDGVFEPLPRCKLKRRKMLKKEAELQCFTLPYQLFCVRKGISIEEAVLNALLRIKSLATDRHKNRSVISYLNFNMWEIFLGILCSSESEELAHESRAVLAMVQLSESESDFVKSDFNRVDYLAKLFSHSSMEGRVKSAAFIEIVLVGIRYLELNCQVCSFDEISDITFYIIRAASNPHASRIKIRKIHKYSFFLFSRKKEGTVAVSFIVEGISCCGVVNSSWVAAMCRKRFVEGVVEEWWRMDFNGCYVMFFIEKGKEKDDGASSLMKGLDCVEVMGVRLEEKKRRKMKMTNESWWYLSACIIGLLSGIGMLRERNKGKAFVNHYLAAENKNLQSKLALAYMYSRQEMYEKAVNLFVIKTARELWLNGWLNTDKMDYIIDEAFDRKSFNVFL